MLVHLRRAMVYFRTMCKALFFEILSSLCIEVITTLSLSYQTFREQSALFFRRKKKNFILYGGLHPPQDRR